MTQVQPPVAFGVVEQLREQRLETPSHTAAAGYGTFPRTAHADAVSDRGPSGEPEQYASRTASLIRAFRAGARLAK